MSQPANTETALRGFLARILGWADEHTQARESAFRSLSLGITHRAALVLLGDTNLVPIAHALHRHAIGDGYPFVVCNPRRRSNMPATIRAPASHERGVVAFRAALGGSLCLLQERTPDDLPAVAALVKEQDASVQIIVLAKARYHLHPFLLRPAPIRVPPLGARADELPRIIDEFARDASRTLGADDAAFTLADRTWVLEHAANTLAEIEKATLRVVALRQAGSTGGAAARLGMSHVALAQWLERRRIVRRPLAGV